MSQKPTHINTITATNSDSKSIQVFVPELKAYHLPEELILLTKEQTARLLQVSPDKVQQLLDRRELDKVKVGHRLVRIPLASVRRFIERRKTKAQAPEEIAEEILKDIEAGNFDDLEEL